MYQCPSPVALPAIPNRKLLWQRLITQIYISPHLVFQNLGRGSLIVGTNDQCFGTNCNFFPKTPDKLGRPFPKPGTNSVYSGTNNILTQISPLCLPGITLFLPGFSSLGPRNLLIASSVSPLCLPGGRESKENPMRRNRGSTKVPLRRKPLLYPFSHFAPLCVFCTHFHRPHYSLFQTIFNPDKSKLHRNRFGL